VIAINKPCIIVCKGCGKTLGVLYENTVICADFESDAFMMCAGCYEEKLNGGMDGEDDTGRRRE